MLEEHPQHNGPECGERRQWCEGHDRLDAHDGPKGDVNDMGRVKGANSNFLLRQALVHFDHIEVMYVHCSCCALQASA